MKSEPDLDEASDRPREGRVSVEALGDDVEHAVRSGIRFALPSGHLMELVVSDSAVAYQSIPRVDPRHRVGIGPVALEHVTLNGDDVEATATFLVEHLGFHITEYARPAAGP